MTLNLQWQDGGVRPQDDFYRHWLGKWLETYEIPEDKAEFFRRLAVSGNVSAVARELGFNLVTCYAWAHKAGWLCQSVLAPG